MNAKRLFCIAAVAILLLGLAACTLSAATPPPTTPTTDSGMSTLEAELGNIATQTAAAGGGGAAPQVPPATAQPGGGAAETPGGGGAAETPAVGGGTPEGGQAATQEPSEPEKPAEFKPTPGLPQTYALQKGEFPFCIARRFNLNQSELLNLNGLGLNSVVPVGFTLRIPQTGNHFSGQRALQSHPTKYTVVAGDTIYTVACKYGDVDPNGIIAVNNLKQPYSLSAGQVLQIP